MRAKKYYVFAILVMLLLLSSGAVSKKEFYRNLSRRLSYNRQNYDYLTDEEFANFREVRTTGIASGKLYRSVSPIQAKNRHAIADEAARRAGVRTFINLADTDNGMKKHEGFSGSYYSTQRVICLNMNLKFMSRRFQQGLAQGIRFMAANEPPYLVHCYWGKDRTGLVCAVIECLMGAGADEVVNDYMLSFYNLFGIEEGTGNYDFVVRNEIEPFLASMLGVKSIYGVNLAEAAERYLLKIGVSGRDIEVLREKLSL